MIKLLSNGHPAEEYIQKAVMEWVSICPMTKAFKDYFIHCPNEGKRSLAYGKKMKSMGMRKGVSDLFIAVGRHGYYGAWIEIKSYSGKVSPEQEKFLKDMAAQNYYTAVCRSVDECMEKIIFYFT